MELRRLKPATPINIDKTYKPIDRPSDSDDGDANFVPIDLDLNIDPNNNDIGLPSDDTIDPGQFDLPDIPDFIPDE